MSDEKVITGWTMHSIVKPASVEIDPPGADWVLGQRIVEMRREDDAKNDQVWLWLTLENGVEIKVRLDPGWTVRVGEPTGCEVSE